MTSEEAEKHIRVLARNIEEQSGENPDLAALYVEALTVLIERSRELNNTWPASRVARIRRRFVRDLQRITEQAESLLHTEGG